MWRHFHVSSNHAVTRHCRQLTAVNIDFLHEVFIFHKPNWCCLIDSYFRHKTPCGIRKLMAAFVSMIGVFSRFSWSLDFGAKMVEFPLPVLHIWRSRKRVAIQIQLMKFMCQNVNTLYCKKSNSLGFNSNTNSNSGFGVGVEPNSNSNCGVDSSPEEYCKSVMSLLEQAWEFSVF